MIWLMQAALAQATDGAMPGLNAQLFRPSIDAPNMIWTDQSLLAPDGYTMGRAALHYVNDPLVYEGDDGERVDLVSGLWQLSLSAAHTRGPLRLGVDLPVYLRSNSALGGETGLGDVGLEARYTALDRQSAPVGLAALVRLGLATATVEAPLGSDTLSWELALVVDRELSDKTVLALNLGTRGLPAVKLENLEWDDQAFARLGLAHALSEDVGVSAELVGNFTYGAAKLPEGRPAELMLGGWKRTGGGLVVRGGLGTAVTQGIGAPRYRVVLGLGYEPAMDRDRDMDGLVDREDSCPDEAEDLDGYLDDDGCPEGTPVRVVVQDAAGQELTEPRWSLGGQSGLSGELIELDAGSWPLSVGGGDWQQQERSVEVPSGGEFTLTVELAAVPGSLRVNAVDGDGKTVDGSFWRAEGTDLPPHETGQLHELPPGEYTVLVIASGYKPARQTVTVTKESEQVVELQLETSRATVTGERIEISDRVYFETNQAVIKSESFSLLDEVSEVLQAHPELVLVRVEGHTDSDGPEKSNLDLSQRRAQAVVDYLISSGVDPERLLAEGYGEGMPVVPNSSPSNKARNRRVEFHVAARSDGPKP